MSANLKYEWILQSVVDLDTHQEVNLVTFRRDFYNGIFTNQTELIVPPENLKENYFYSIYLNIKQEDEIGGIVQVYSKDIEVTVKKLSKLMPFE